MRKFGSLSLSFLLVSLMVSPGISADKLKPLSKKLSDGLKDKPKVTIAVLNFPYAQNRSSTGSHLVSERLVTYLVQGGATIVERRLLGKILEERKLWETGLMRPEVAQKVGAFVGADTVLTGLLCDISETSTEVFARIVRIDTGEIISAASAVIERIWRDPPRLPRAAQPRSAVPGAFIPLESEEENSISPSHPTQLSIPSQSGKRRRYYPTAVPFLIPSTKAPAQGGPSK